MSISFNDYRAFDALGLATAIRKGDLSRREVLDAALARVAEANPRVNAISYLHTDGADTAQADPGAPFAGVPYFIKDLHAPVAGIPLRHGSRLFEGNVHDFDSETVARLRRAGFLILGRTASPELFINVEGFKSSTRWPPSSASAPIGSTAWAPS